MTAARLLTIAISAATGTCFAVLAGMSISAVAVPVRRFHAFSAVIGGVAICLAYLAFRAATSSETDDETVIASLSSGIIGALVGLIFIVSYLFMYGPDAHSTLAHALGKPSSILTTFRLLTASTLLGFGTGFVLRIPRTRVETK